jgi:hypothetical protein
MCFWVGNQTRIDMWGLWLALDCLDNKTVAAGVLICSDSHWALNALKEDIL